VSGDWAFDHVRLVHPERDGLRISADEGFRANLVALARRAAGILQIGPGSDPLRVHLALAVRGFDLEDEFALSVDLDARARQHALATLGTGIELLSQEAVVLANAQVMDFAAAVALARLCARLHRQDPDDFMRLSGQLLWELYDAGS